MNKLTGTASLHTFELESRWTDGPIKKAPLLEEARDAPEVTDDCKETKS